MTAESEGIKQAGIGIRSGEMAWLKNEGSKRPRHMSRLLWLRLPPFHRETTECPIEGFPLADRDGGKLWTARQTAVGARDKVDEIRVYRKGGA